MNKRRWAMTAIGLLVSLSFFLDLEAGVSAQIKTESKTIDYDLVYAGILPDHPLFFLKGFRDRLWEFATRDSLKKARLYLLFADKRLRMAIELSEESKWPLAAESAKLAEDYLLRIPALLTVSKKQGSAAEGDFIVKLKTAADKHGAVLESLIKDAPPPARKSLTASLQTNKAVKSKFSPL